MPSNNEKRHDKYKRVRKLVEKLKSMGLTDEEKQYIKTELEAA
jgi:5-bromo-4-chloroindolyl phosphate hydrolysis protein